MDWLSKIHMVWEPAKGRMVEAKGRMVEPL